MHQSYKEDYILPNQGIPIHVIYLLSINCSTDCPPLYKMFPHIKTSFM